jgi:hypothetical protein
LVSTSLTEYSDAPVPVQALGPPKLSYVRVLVLCLSCVPADFCHLIQCLIRDVGHTAHKSLGSDGQGPQGLAFGFQILEFARVFCSFY